jgi:BCD family chlorophyll transporter-like MFS transporter
MPFADLRGGDVRLRQLLRLSLFQLSVGMVQTLFFGTLNRVMIVELHLSAALVSIFIAIPLLVAPFRALVGFRSDTHRSVLGWRRVPFILMGTLLQFGGLAIMPFALLAFADGTASTRASRGTCARRSRLPAPAPGRTPRRPPGSRSPPTSRPIGSGRA